MKKISLLITLAFLAFSASLFGQKSDNVTLNVKLNAIQTLVVNSKQNNITLEYITKENYQDGIESENKDHLTVYSTGGFVLQAESTNSAFNILGVTLIAKTGTTTGLPGLNMNIPLTDQSKKTVYTSDKGMTDHTADITYAGKGNNEYFNLLGKDLNKTYNTTVTYTLIPK